MHEKFSDIQIEGKISLGSRQNVVLRIYLKEHRSSDKNLLLAPFYDFRGMPYYFIEWHFMLRLLGARAAIYYSEERLLFCVQHAMSNS